MENGNNQYKIKIPQVKSIIPLHNEYSILNTLKNKRDPLGSLSNDLLVPVKTTLPSIRSTNRKPSSLRKLQNRICQLKNMIDEKLQKKKRQQYQYQDDRLMTPPQYIPMPIPFPMYNNYPQFPPYEQKPEKRRKKKNKKKKKKQEYISSSSEEQIIEKPKKKKVPPKKKSPYNKFRIYAYAVYFCIFMKYYSKTFTKNRKKWFNDRYITNDGQILSDQSEQVLKILYDIDLYTMWKDSSKNKKDQTLNSLNNSKVQVPQNSSKKIINFVDSFIDALEDLFTSQNFVDNYHEVFSVGTLDKNYLISNLYLPQQTPFLRIHPKQGYLIVNDEGQVTLLMVKSMIKMIIFNYLLTLKKSRLWKSRQEKINDLDSHDLDDLLKNLKTITNYIYILCEEMYILALENKKYKSNFYDVAPIFNVKTAKSLYDLNSKQKEQNSILIKNLGGYEQTQNLIKKNASLRKYKKDGTRKIVKLLQNLYQCLKYEERQTYNFIHQLTIQVPYIIKNGIQTYGGGTKKKKHKKGSILKNKIKERPKNYTENSYQNVDSEQNLKSRTRQSKESRFKKSNTKENQVKFQRSRDNKVNQSELISKGNTKNNSYLRRKTDNSQDYSYEDEEDEDESDESEADERRRHKYNHEQLINDSKYQNHEHLKKIKNKMKLLKQKKVI